MVVQERIEAFSALGKYLLAIDDNERNELIDKVKMYNPWFTDTNVSLALEGLQNYLHPERLIRWTAAYPHELHAPKEVALVMAGNIPLAGFHDLLSVLISGHHAQVKLSSKDAVLIPWLTEKLCVIEPRFRGTVAVTDRLKDFDAVIATGSDNSARYFNYYFGKYPHIIRKNRTSAAVLSGNETTDEFRALAHDVFSYFGLGCRNVSKFYVPEGYSFSPLLDSWEIFQPIIHHHKYNNNYDYQKSIMLVNSVPFFDNGFVMLTQNERMVSPISVVYYDHYATTAALKEKIAADQEKIQCVVGKISPATVAFGQAQHPQLWDYADNVDTMKFLSTLHS